MRSDARRVSSGPTGATPPPKTRLRAALGRARAVMDDSHLVVAALRNDLAVTAKHLGRPAEGEVLLRQALRAIETSVGPEHPAVATVLHKRGRRCLRLRGSRPRRSPRPARRRRSRRRPRR